MYSDIRPARTTAYGDSTQSTIYGIRWGTILGAATVFRWRWNVILCIYELLYLGQEIQGWCPRWAPGTSDLYDTDMRVMKGQGQARLEPPRNPALKSVAYATSSGGTGCKWGEGIICQGTSRKNTRTRPKLDSLHACYFVSWLQQCTHRKRPYLLLVAMLLFCYALPPCPRRLHVPAPVAVANAKIP